MYSYAVMDSFKFFLVLFCANLILEVFIHVLVKCNLFNLAFIFKTERTIIASCLMFCN